MSFVLGRNEAKGDEECTGRLGRYRAVDGSDGAPLYVDLDGPHAVLVVGKRGYGKSYTLGVLAESLATANGVAPVIVDPMGAFRPMATGDHDVAVEPVREPTVSADALDPRSWCSLLGLSPESGPGGLVWQAAREASTLPGMRSAVAATEARTPDVRAAINHLELAGGWDVFDPDGLDATALSGPELTVVDVSGLDAAPMNAVVRAIAETLYRGRVDERIDSLPWLLLDEAHAFFDGVAAEALHRLLTRGRAPGVSFVAATQRPGALPEVAVSQSDIVVSHRLTARADLSALEAARPTYAKETFSERMPSDPGDVLVVDDATETVHAAIVRTRRTPHGGGDPSASDLSKENPDDRSTTRSSTRQNHGQPIKSTDRDY